MKDSCHETFNIDETAQSRSKLSHSKSAHVTSATRHRIASTFAALVAIGGVSYEKPAAAEENEESMECKVIVPKKGDAEWTLIEGSCRKGLASGKGKAVSSDGDHYKGKFKDGMFHGGGEFAWYQGNNYEGNWKSGKKNGRGTLNLEHYGSFRVFPNCVRSPASSDEWFLTEENCRDGLANGLRVAINNRGYRYEGGFKDGRFDGQGALSFVGSTDTILVGPWENGRISSSCVSDPMNEWTLSEGNCNEGDADGLGKAVSRDGSTYEGEFLKGKFHGQGTYKRQDGATYTGEFKNNEYNGHGTFTHPNGAQYTGNFLDGKSHGQGTYKWPDGSEYIGEWKEGKKHGQGTLTFSNGNKYNGNFENDLFNGQGTYTSADGRKYVGEWEEGKKHGQGTFSWPDGKKYVGEWKDDEENGQGVMTHADGTTLIGGWIGGKISDSCVKTSSKLWTLVTGDCGDGLVDGKGRAISSDGLTDEKGKALSKHGDVYEGDFIEGQFHGQGEYIYQDGKKYSGAWVTGLKQGYGVMTYPDGSTLTGPWENDGIASSCLTTGWILKIGKCDDGKANGPGESTGPNLESYIGEFKNGKKHGKGTLISSNGDRYTGEFQNDLRHGPGTLYRDGTTYAGQWIKDNLSGQCELTLPFGEKYSGALQNNAPHGQGTLVMPNGEKYRGNFKNGLFDGQGTYTFPNGGKYTGEWKQGKKHGYGTLIEADGEKYVGNFENNLFHGQGTFYESSGITQSGQWERGSLPHSSATWGFKSSKYTTPSAIYGYAVDSASRGDNYTAEIIYKYLIRTGGNSDVAAKASRSLRQMQERATRQDTLYRERSRCREACELEKDACYGMQRMNQGSGCYEAHEACKLRCP